MKLDLDFKDEKIGALNKELEELQVGGGASEEEVSSLKRQKHDLEMRLKDQEEELDDLAGQVQMLEQAKTKLEMSMAAQKKEHRRELSSKDDELEDARTSTQKKVSNFLTVSVIICYCIKNNIGAILELLPINTMTFR